MTEETRPREEGPAGADEPQKGLAGKRYSHLTERNRCRFTRAKVKRIEMRAEIVAILGHGSLVLEHDAPVQVRVDDVANLLRFMGVLGAQLKLAPVGVVIARVDDAHCARICERFDSSLI